MRMEGAESDVAAFNQNEGEKGAQKKHSHATGDENEDPSVLHALVTQLDEFDAGLFPDRTARGAEH